MTGCTINIAEFRCRAVSRVTSSSNPRSGRARALSVTDADTRSKDRERDLLQIDLLQDAILQEDPTVYDIGVAREAQRLRHRTVFRPISNQRKAKVLRFRDEVAVRVKMRAEEARGGEPWSNRPDGPYDLPPAA
jgi:hypothetical protein